MNFSADQNLFSFKLGGTDAFGLAHEKQTFVDGDQTITTYKFGFLKITNVFKKYGNYGAVEWVNYFEISKEENRSGANLFISIHCNGATSPQAHGVEVLYCEGSQKSQPSQYGVYQ